MPAKSSKPSPLSRFGTGPRRDMSLTPRPTLAFCTAALLAAAAPLAAQRGPAPEMTHLPADVIAQACPSTLALERPAEALPNTGGQGALPPHPQRRERRG